MVAACVNVVHRYLDIGVLYQLLESRYQASDDFIRDLTYRGRGDKHTLT